MTIYFISGLGADKRMFKNLSLPPQYSLVYIDWIEPLHEHEPLQSYCQRLAEGIDSSKDFVLVGLSLGGLAAIEIARFLKPKDIILISSIATKYELPWTFRVGRFFKLDQIIPLHLLKTPSALLTWLFGAKTGEEKSLLKSVLVETTDTFLKWSVGQILYWNNKIRPEKLYHIHGTADKLLLCWQTKADIKIRGGEHLMVLSKAGEISSLMEERLKGV
ncbi:MAG: alpha/beta hydrolase [Chitinophagaceae bacterium]